MQESFNEIDNLFKGNIESFEMTPSEKVWDSLDNTLEKRANSKYKVIVFRLRAALVTLLLLFGTFVVYHFSVTNIESKEVTTDKPEILSSGNTDQMVSITAIENKSKSNNEKSFNQKEKRNSSIMNTSSFNTLLNKHSEATLKKTKISFPNYNENTATINPKGSSFTNLIESKEREFIDSKVIPDSMLENSNLNQPIASSIQKGDLPDSIISPESTDITPKGKLIKRFSFIAYFSPDLTKKYLVDDNTDNQSQSEYDGQESSDFSFNTGFLFGYDVTPKWSIKSGITYAYLMQSIKPKTVYVKTGNNGQQYYQFNTSYGSAQIPSDASTTQLSDSLRIKTSSTQLLQLVSVPLIAKYQIQRNKFSFYGQFGIAVNVLVGEKLLVETPNRTESITNIEGLREFNFGGIVGLGVSYNPIKKLSIMVEPTFRGSLTPINQNTSVKSYPYSLGLAIGLGWHL